MIYKENEVYRMFKKLFDTTEKEYLMKKEVFCGVKNMIIITPSEWLKGLVEKSFLSEYNIRLINNGVNLDIYKFTKDENVLKKYYIPNDRRVILGVANVWTNKKGLNDLF